MEELLRGLGFDPVPIDGSEAANGLRYPVSLCLVDLRQNGEAMKIARAVRTQHPRAIVIGVADPARPTAAADAIRAGVFDVLPRPASARDLEALLANAREQASLAAGDTRPHDAGSFGLVGVSSAMRVVMDLVQRSAAGRCGILIGGERGTGREILARALHAQGPNRQSPFIKLDCSGPSPEEIEQHLFGLVGRKANGAAPERRSLERIGHHSRLADANGGILFLENVAEMPARAQARLVRILRDRETFFD